MNFLKFTKVVFLPCFSSILLSEKHAFGIEKWWNNLLMILGSAILRSSVDTIVHNFFENLFAINHPRNFEKALEGVEQLVTEDMTWFLITNQLVKRHEKPYIRCILIKHPNVIECMHFSEILTCCGR